MEVILKFFANEQDTSSIISRTLGKIAIIERSYVERALKGKAKMPVSGEFWRCKIVKELKNGASAGSFLVRPVEVVQSDDLLHLLPSMYSSVVNSGRMIITPNPEYIHRACILPLDHKHIFSKSADAYCILVDVTRKAEDKTRYTHDNPYSGREG